MEKLRSAWSPEQIAGRLKKICVEDKSMQIHWETIYRYIYSEANKEKALWEYLPRKRKKRKKKNGRKVQKCRIEGRISIHRRPKKVTERREFGHWEGDTVEGKGHRDGVHTELERVSRLYKAKKVSAIKGDVTSEVQIQIFGEMPKRARRSTTFDNGKENVRHKRLVKVLGMRTYFCDPYSSWQKGSNEYHNGLLRRYFPKGTDFSKVEQEEIDDIIEEINNRPRKILGYSTPNEVFAQNLSSVRIKKRM
ncbi:IS30 family transposase [Patescibacteria group bacterium]|nr:IS30 family transposase [Patescibacteria group bacterium]